MGRPGYFNLPLETRLDDLIMLSGGPTIDAATGEIKDRPAVEDIKRQAMALYQAQANCE